MVTFADLARDNPNIRAQYDAWREARAANGEDPVDWGAFRQEVLATGAPDPGPRPPDDFVGEDFKAANPEWTRRWYGSPQNVQLREEELRPRTESVQAGEVGLRKEVVTEQRTMDVPVTREEAVIERHPVEPRPASGDIQEGEAARVPLREERVQVEKQPVVTEEVSIGKRQVQETEQVSGTVRREEARVETEGQVDVRGGEPRRDNR